MSGLTAFRIDGVAVVVVSAAICLASARIRFMSVLVGFVLVARFAIWRRTAEARIGHGLGREAVFFLSCLLVGAFNDWNTVVRHRVYAYTVPTDLAPWSSIPTWMLLYWGIILRFVHSLSQYPRFATSTPARTGWAERLRIPIALVLVLATRQAIYRTYDHAWLSWSPFAVGLVIYLLLYPPDRATWRYLALLGLGGPVVEGLYIQVGGLHRYELGRLGGVPLWIALWWVLAGLVWRDLSPRFVALLKRTNLVATRTRPA